MASKKVNIGNLIHQISGPKSFSAHLTAPPNHLKMEVKGVGPLKFPINIKQAKALIKEADLAPFGHKEKTIVDLSVRNVWEIKGSKVKIDKKLWNQTFQPILEELHDSLGMPEGRIQAKLDKLLIYEKRQFFTVHQDSEKEDNMLASLVVALPSVHKGGQLIVSHHKENKKHNIKKADMEKLNFFGFYSDCYHEIKKVTEGYRVILTYHISVGSPQDPPQILLKENNQKKLHQAIKSYFESPTTNPSSGPYEAEKRRLVYFLDHQYTPKNLSPKTLKGVDNFAFQALKQTSDELGLNIFLALANTHEMWNCIEEYPRHGHGYSDYYDGEGSEGNYDLEELIEESTSLDDWRSFDGKKLNYGEVGVSDSEIFFGRPNSQFKPHNEEYEGFMGNYGNTLDRWYHRATIVLWPKEKHFDLMHGEGPEYVISLIEEALQSGDKNNIKKTITAWENLRSYRSYDDQELLKKALSLAKRFQDPQLSKKILSHFQLTEFKSSLITPFLSLSDSYGKDFCGDIMEHWYKNCSSHTEGLNHQNHILSLIKRLQKMSGWGPLCSFVSRRGGLSFYRKVQGGE